MTCEPRDIPYTIKLPPADLIIGKLTKEIQCCTHMTGEQSRHKEMIQMGKDIRRPPDEAGTWSEHLDPNLEV